MCLPMSLSWSEVVFYFFISTVVVFFLKLYFIDYAITVVLTFPVCLPPPFTQYPSTPSGNSPHHCSCPWVMCICSLTTSFPILYFVSPWLLCNYLFVLNILTSSPIPPHPLSSGNHQNTLHIHDSVSVLLVCLVCVLDSIVDRYVFIAILLFIVLIFFFNVSLTFHIIMV